MSGVNKAILVGNLGRDPELKEIGDGKVCNFSIATTKTYKDRNGEKQEDTQWHNIEVWGNQADSCAQYLSKGRQVFVEGEIKTKVTEQDDGSKKYYTSIRALSVQFLGSKGGASEGGEEIPF